MKFTESLKLVVNNPTENFYSVKDVTESNELMSRLSNIIRDRGISTDTAGIIIRNKSNIKRRLRIENDLDGVDTKLVLLNTGVSSPFLGDKPSKLSFELGGKINHYEAFTYQYKLPPNLRNTDVNTRHTNDQTHVNSYYFRNNLDGIHNNLYTDSLGLDVTGYGMVEKRFEVNYGVQNINNFYIRYFEKDYSIEIANDVSDAMATFLLNRQLMRISEHYSGYVKSTVEKVVVDDVYDIHYYQVTRRIYLGTTGHEDVLIPLKTVKVDESFGVRAKYILLDRTVVLPTENKVLNSDLEKSFRMTINGKVDEEFPLLEDNDEITSMRNFLYLPLEITIPKAREWSLNPLDTESGYIDSTATPAYDGRGYFKIRVNKNQFKVTDYDHRLRLLHLQIKKDVEIGKMVQITGFGYSITEPIIDGNRFPDIIIPIPTLWGSSLTEDESSPFINISTSVDNDKFIGYPISYKPEQVRGNEWLFGSSTTNSYSHNNVYPIGLAESGHQFVNSHTNHNIILHTPMYSMSGYEDLPEEFDIYIFVRELKRPSYHPNTVDHPHNDGETSRGIVTSLNNFITKEMALGMIDEDGIDVSMNYLPNLSYYNGLISYEYDKGLAYNKYWAENLPLRTNVPNKNPESPNNREFILSSGNYYTRVINPDSNKRYSIENSIPYGYESFNRGTPSPDIATLVSFKDGFDSHLPKWSYDRRNRIYTRKTRVNIGKYIYAPLMPEFTHLHTLVEMEEVDFTYHVPKLTMDRLEITGFSISDFGTKPISVNMKIYDSYFPNFVYYSDGNGTRYLHVLSFKGKIKATMRPKEGGDEVIYTLDISDKIDNFRNIWHRDFRLDIDFEHNDMYDLLNVELTEVELVTTTLFNDERSTITIP